MKICTKCGEEKEEGEFHFTGKIRKDGTESRKFECKICSNKRSSAWRKANPERHDKSILIWKKNNRFRVMLHRSRCAAKHDGHIPCSATSEKLEAAFTGKCYICRTEEAQCNKHLHMDHCHKTGAFRGFLCESCNYGLGIFKDSPQLLEIAAAYLRASIKESFV